LVDAVARANDEAGTEGSFPPWNYAPVVGKKGDGSDVQFRLKSCLVIGGYGELTFNAFNHVNDW
jgi:hypothetical protein